jgi:hypothetical protein
MTRIGEIILIEQDGITIECYLPKADLLGALVSTENQSHMAIVGGLTSICIEAGKSSQAFGNEHSSDSSNDQAFPHLKNSLRVLGKAYSWEKFSSFLTLNQGLYLVEFSSTIFDDLNYWRTLAKLSFDSITPHINWLRNHDPLFNIDLYLQKLSQHSRPLAWNLYLQNVEYT